MAGYNCLFFKSVLGPAVVKPNTDVTTWLVRLCGLCSVRWQILWGWKHSENFGDDYGFGVVEWK